MFYDAELAFLQALLNNFHIHSSRISPCTSKIKDIDCGLHHLLGLHSYYEEIRNFLLHQVKNNIIYKFRDSFCCNHIFLQLPHTEPPMLLIIGPYTTTEITNHSLMQLTEKYTLPSQIFSLLASCLSTFPYLANDTMLMLAVNTLGEKIWGGTDKFAYETYDFNYSSQSLPLSRFPELSEDTQVALHMQALENRYLLENRFLQAVSQGLTHKAEHIFSSISPQSFEQRTQDPIRNLQNYSVILNTLLRKAAEQGTVHPLYIDRLSSDFARKIETVTTPEAVHKLQRDMIHRYCLLVKNHSMKGYSLLVQKVIIQIDSDLTANLSLNALAECLSVNASYLSSLFKKETGTTLTEYVNRKRMEHGIFLLNSTTLQIQTIAQYCGIPDVNYFTKLFKKYYNKTPKDYRESILHG